MKTKFLSFTLIAILLSHSGIMAQWATSGSNIYNTNTGNVGIGTTTPAAKLEVFGPGLSNAYNFNLKNNSSNVISIYSTGNAEFYHSAVIGYRSRGTIASPTNVLANDRIVSYGANGYISGGYRGLAAMEIFAGSTPGASSYPGYIVFQTTANNNTSRVERMRISESGNIGIGTSSPSYLLHVNGGMAATSYTTLSDERFKMNIRTIENPLDKISQIEGHTYRFNASKFKERNFPKGEKLGFLAQEVQKVFPDLVTSDNEGYLGVDYNGLIPVMLEAIKELKTRLDFTQQLLSDKLTSSVSEVNEMKQKGVFLDCYPNPASASFKIAYATADEDKWPTIIIHDLRGKQIKSFALEAGSGNLEVNSNDLQEGLYLLTLTGNNQPLLTRKILISR